MREGPTEVEDLSCFFPKQKAENKDVVHLCTCSACSEVFPKYIPILLLLISIKWNSLFLITLILPLQSY